MDASGEIRFDGWILRRQPRDLFRDGKRIRLQELPLQILEELLSQPGELVTREQLIARLWPKRIVDFDTALNAAVRRLRAALGDDAETPRYIETIPRRGYRFIGTIVAAAPLLVGRAQEPAASGRKPPRSWWQWGGVVALGVMLVGGSLLWSSRDREVTPIAVESASPPPQAVVKSIAVLPFTDLSPEQDQQYFSDGLTEEILNLLAQAQQLRVTARTSSFSFRGQNVDIDTVARKLGVTHVLEGSVRKSGDRVRITAQLVDGATSTHLWSQTYERKLDDVFLVQSDIATSVAGALQVALGFTGRPVLHGGAQAYEDFFRAHFFFQRRAPGDLERARQYYQQTLELDPNFARAWAGLAGVYWIQTVEGSVERDIGLEQLRAAADRALALDPDLAEAHLRRVNYLRATGNRSAAARHEDRAAELEPHSPLVLAFKASSAVKDGLLDQAIELQRQAVAADPRGVINRIALASLLFSAGRLEEAKTESNHVPELDPSRPAITAAQVLIYERRFDEALRSIETWPEGADRTQCLALAYHGLGRKADANGALTKLIETAGASDPLRVAEVHAYRGEIDEAFRWLQAAARMDWERRQPWAETFPFLQPLHTDPRWNEWRASRR